MALVDRYGLFYWLILNKAVFASVTDGVIPMLDVTPSVAEFEVLSAVGIYAYIPILTPGSICKVLGRVKDNVCRTTRSLSEDILAIPSQVACVGIVHIVVRCRNQHRSRGDIPRLAR